MDPTEIQQKISTQLPADILWLNAELAALKSYFAQLCIHNTMIAQVATSLATFHSGKLLYHRRNGTHGSTNTLPEKVAKQKDIMV